MYAFRKPFTAATYEGQEFLDFGLKSVLVMSQLAGYMLSKFIGIKVVSEMPGHRRARAIIVLILMAEAALVGFAVAPLPLKVVMLFLNGLPLGMVFGLVLAYLEGRRQTEALSAALCASFIISSGVVKSVGQWLMQDLGLSEFSMPMAVGLIFFPPLLASVWLLGFTPPPDDDDERLRSARTVMPRSQRRRFLSAYWPGLSLLLFVYMALTVIRTIRDDFGVEIWRDMGVTETPSVFTRSEIVVGLCVTGLNALAIGIRHNLFAIRVTIGLMCAAFGLVGGSVFLRESNAASPFVFMVLCGVGLYVPYVAFHTTVFERLIAAARRPANLGFLMYVADAFGYLGYGVVMLVRSRNAAVESVLPFFLSSLLTVAVVSILALVMASVYFQRVLSTDDRMVRIDDAPAAIEELAPAE